MKANIYRVGYLLTILYMIVSLCGCTIFSNIADNIAGNYMSSLERIKADGQTKIFNYEINECFKKVLAILDEEIIDVKILKIDRRSYSILLLVSRPMIEEADSVFYANSADVGIFFTPESANNTKVQITSLSSLFVDHTAEKIFTKL